MATVIFLQNIHIHFRMSSATLVFFFFFFFFGALNSTAFSTNSGRRQTDDILLMFPRKPDMIFHVNCPLILLILSSRNKYKIKALTVLVSRLSLSVCWENSPERGPKTVLFYSLLPVI